MAVILIDVFSFINSLSEQTTVEVYFDTEDVLVSYVVTEGSLTSGNVGTTNRGRLDGAVIGSYPNDDNNISYTLGSEHIPNYASVISDDPIDPEPESCDLAIDLTATNETSQGANNGSVAINSTSSFTGIQVSIDNVNWFSPPKGFSGLAPGNYTAYAKDDNGCTATKPFAVEAYDNPIDGGFGGGLPVVTVSAGNISRWNAAFNPVVLNFTKTPDPSKPNFRIEIEITSNSGVVVGQWSPNTSGYTRADISAYLRTLVNANDDFQYDVLNWRDLNRASSYTLRYREVWDGDSSTWYNAPYPMYVTWSAKQLGDIYGGNMAEYVTFSDEPNPNLKAKWLTLFNEPIAWVGLPFDNSFILSEYVVDENIKLRTTSLDINRQEVSGGVVNSFLLNNDAGYILADSDSRLIIQQGALPPVSNDGIFEQFGINRLMLAGTPAAGVEYFVIQLYTGTDESPNYITQPLTIKVNSQCNDPYIYLKWMNTLGGWDYWRFGHDQVLQLSTSDEISIDRNVFYWDNDETIADTIKKNAVNRISFGAFVPEENVDGIIGIQKSTKIQRLVSLSPLKWQTVTINSGQFDIKRTKTKGAQVKFTISLPQINIQQQ